MHRADTPIRPYKAVVGAMKTYGQTDAMRRNNNIGNQIADGII